MTLAVLLGPGTGLDAAAVNAAAVDGLPPMRRLLAAQGVVLQARSLLRRAAKETEAATDYHEKPPLESSRNESPSGAELFETLAVRPPTKTHTAAACPLSFRCVA